MPGALLSIPLRGSEPTSTSGRAAITTSHANGNACSRAVRCELRTRASQHTTRVHHQLLSPSPHFFTAAKCAVACRGASDHRRRADSRWWRCRAGGGATPALSVDEEIWNSRDTPPHPSPPEDLSPTDLLVGECTIQELAVQVATLKALVQAQQDILYSQKAQIDQLTETLLEERQRARLQQQQGVATPASTGASDAIAASAVAPGYGSGSDPVALSPAAAPESAAAAGPSQRSVQRPFDSQRIPFGDRRLMGLYDARFHSTHIGAIPTDFRILPDRIILVRHAESEGNVDNKAYTYIPDSQVPLTARGHMQAREAGRRIKAAMEADPGRADDYKLFFYISPYKRSLQTYEGISSQFPSHHLLGVQEEVQLREQDFGNFQDAQGKQHEKAERLRFGRFFYRFPNGESGADVYDRITIFEDHMVRDINAGRFADNTGLVLVTHGLALRIFLMRWFHWTVDEFLSVYNPANAEPLILERCPAPETSSWRHTKSLYRLTDESMRALRGCTLDMCATDTLPRKSLKVSTRLM